MDGGLFGGQIGYNAKYNNWVLGIEADFQGTGQRGGSSFCLDGGLSARLDRDHLRLPSALVRYLARARRLARRSQPAALRDWRPRGRRDRRRLYGERHRHVAAPLGTFSAKATRAGFVVGGGGEYRFSSAGASSSNISTWISARSTRRSPALPDQPAVIITVGDFRFIGVSTTTTQCEGQYPHHRQHPARGHQFPASDPRGVAQTKSPGPSPGLFREWRYRAVAGSNPASFQCFAFAGSARNHERDRGLGRGVRREHAGRVNGVELDLRRDQPRERHALLRNDLAHRIEPDLGFTFADRRDATVERRCDASPSP